MLTDRADLLCAGEPWGQGCWGQGSRKWAGGHQPWHQGADCPGVYVIICTTWFAIPVCVHYYWHHTVCFSYHPDVCIIFTTWFAYLTTRMCTSLFVPHGLPLLPPRCVHHYLFNTVCPYFHPDVYIIFCTHCLPFLPPWCLHHCLRYTVCPFYQTVVYIIICAILFARSDTVMCIALLIVYSPFAPWCVHLLYQTHGWDFSSDSQILEFRFFSESNKNKTKQTRKQCWDAFWMWFFTFQSSNFNPVPSLRTNCLVCSSLCQTICLVCTCYATSFVPCCVPGTSCYSVYISLFIPTLFALYLNHTVEAPGIYMVTIMADYSQMRICSIMCTWFMLRYLPFIIIIYPLIARVVGAPQMISQPVSSIFPCSPLPCGTWQTPGLSIPWCCLPTSSSVCLVFFFPFTVPCKMVLVRPDERKAWPYHCSLRLFTIVRSSCASIAWWILARTSSLLTWSLYETCSILR